MLYNDDEWLTKFPVKERAEYEVLLLEYRRRQLAAQSRGLEAAGSRFGDADASDFLGRTSAEHDAVKNRVSEATAALRENPFLPLAIVGPGGCGKDTVATWFRDHCGVRFTGGTSSVIAREVARRDGISLDAALANRRCERERWRAVGDALCRDDPAALVRALVPDQDVIVGPRRRREINEARRHRLVQCVVWIDRPGLPRDPTLEFGPELADLFIPNHRDLGYLFSWLTRTATLLGLSPASFGGVNP